MDTASVMARFDAERQALALMNHPNVARALDAFSQQRRILVLADDAGTGVRDSLTGRIRQLQ